MGLFTAIRDFIFHKQAQDPSVPQAAAPVMPSTSSAIAPATTMATPAIQEVEKVDVAPILDQAVANSGEKLNWRTSIVDLMKVCGLDSSLEHRKELANELGYTGDTSDSATMNIWLHKQVMAKLEEGGGMVPAELK